MIAVMRTVYSRRRCSVLSDRGLLRCPVPVSSYDIDPGQYHDCGNDGAPK
jgi:hypothetical protein